VINPDRDLLSMLLDEANQNDENYVRSTIDRDTWAKSMRDVDDKLRIFGLALSSRMWEEKRSAGF
jgi:hypothetical protein